MRLDRRRLNRTLLRRQLLSVRGTVPAIDAVELLVGLQAQTPMSPYLALWSRLEDFDPAELGGLIEGRGAVRIALQRSTIHLVSAADCLALRPVLQPMIERSLNGNFRRQLEGVDRAALAQAGRELVEEEPRTFAELGALLGERWPDHDPQALAMGVRTMVALVQVPPRGVWGMSGQARHTSAEAWLGRPLQMAAEPDEMVLRYLRAFGPASVKDVQVWSGLTRIREVIGRLEPQLRCFADENGVELWDVLDAPIAEGDEPAPARFLPDYDNIFLSHADRSRVIATEHRPLIFGRNGVFPSVLVDGFAAATWTAERGNDRITIVIRPFAKLSKRTAAEVTAEAHAAAGFLGDGSQSDVRFEPPA